MRDEKIMSFKDCILGKIEEQKISQTKGKELLKKYDQLLNKYKLAGTSEDAAILAADDLLQTEARIIEQRQRNLKQHALKQKEINDRFTKYPGKPEKVAGDILQKAAYRGEAVEKRAFSLINQISDSLKVDALGLGRNYDRIANGVRSLLGDEVGDAEAVKVGNVMKQTFDLLHSQLRQAGGVIGKIANYFPQVHSKDAILRSKVGKEGWIDFIYPLLDTSKIIDEETGAAFEGAKLKGVLGDVYESIITSGRSDLKRISEKGEMPKGFGGDIDMRHSKSRFLHFKNADAFMAYNNKFGTGDRGLAEAFLGKVKSLSRDIGILEHMGPKPDAMMRFMDFKMGAEGQSPLKRNWVNAQYRVLASRFEEGNTDSIWWSAFTGTHNWLRSAMLGSAPISAISDTAMMAATAKVNGLDGMRVLKGYVEHLAPGDREVKQIARRSGFIAEILGGAALQDTRFAGESQGSGFTAALAQLTHKVSGLQAMTKATQDAIALEGSATLAEALSAKKAWSSLPEDLRLGLERFGMDESDWGDLGKAQIYDQGEAKFLITSELRLDKNLSAKRAKDIADKLDDWTMYLRQAAATEPLLATRAITTGAILGDGGPGTPSRYIGATVGLFKSFPITGMLTHTLPAIQRARTQRKFDQLALTMIGTTILGAGAIQFRELSKGKTPQQDMGNYKFMMRAFLQGGGAGLFGDFFLGDYSRFDRTPITEALGPGVGLFEDIYKATKGNLDGWATSRDGDISEVPKNVAGDMFRVVKRNVPLGSLWYGRLAFERLMLDNLERMIDPGFDRRVGKYERKIKKESGQEFWWRPGESRPQ